MRKLVLLFCCLYISLCAWADTADTEKSQQLTDAALAQTHTFVIYNSAYFNIPYPKGDMPAQFGDGF